MGASTEVEMVAVNEVRLVGRVSAELSERELPSGDVLGALRVTVPREDGGRSRQRVDAIECVVWLARLRRSTATWRLGDQVEVVGALRRRFFQTGAGAASRFEVELTSARVIRRAST